MTLTFQQRLQYLIQHGDYDPVLVAAVLGLDLATVEQMMSDPTYEPPSAGGGSRRTIACPFAYNTPGLAAGLAVYTPESGDIVRDGWVRIITAWDGTTPRGDWGVAPLWQNGMGQNLGGTLDMTLADWSGNWEYSRNGRAQDGLWPSIPATMQNAVYGANNARINGSWPRFIPGDAQGNAILVCVSQTGLPSGADAGATQGAAILFLDIDTPQQAPV